MDELLELLNQCRKPNGEEGKSVVEEMNKTHYELTTFGLEKINIKENDVILDIGCGGGRTVNRLAKLSSKGKVSGMDYSSDCVNWATSYNSDFIQNGHVEIVQGSVEHIPFEDNKFDVITAVETIYFWPDLVQNFKEVKRVLKTDGKFVIINEMFLGDYFKERNKECIEKGNMKIKSAIELKNIIEKSGFNILSMDKVEEKNWLCIVCQ